jgi:hypothetical protein
MEEALRPVRYISEHASFSVVNELESVAARIAEGDPERAVGLYQTFIAACYEKADTGVNSEPEPSFLEKARARWAPPE